MIQPNKTTKTARDNNTYDFYHGDITVTVSGDFGEVSIECFYHGSMGEDNLLKYSDTCDVTPPIIINLQPISR